MWCEHAFRQWHSHRWRWQSWILWSLPPLLRPWASLRPGMWNIVDTHLIAFCCVCWAFVHRINGHAGRICRPNLHVRTGDAAAYVADRLRRSAKPLDAVFLDAFDGDDNVPESLCSPGDGSSESPIW